jgi:hypothetical protein
MTLYMLVIEVTSQAGDSISDVAGIFDNKEVAVGYQDRFNNLGLNRDYSCGCPKAKIEALILNECGIEFDRLEKERK